MTEVKYDRNHHSGADADARIRNRLRNSGDTANADSVTKTGDGPTRAITNIHHSRNLTHGEGQPGENDVYGNKRGVI